MSLSAVSVFSLSSRLHLIKQANGKEEQHYWIYLPSFSIPRILRPVHCFPCLTSSCAKWEKTAGESASLISCSQRAPRISSTISIRVVWRPDTPHSYCQAVLQRDALRQFHRFVTGVVVEVWLELVNFSLTHGVTDGTMVSHDMVPCYCSNMTVLYTILWK